MHRRTTITSEGITEIARTESNETTTTTMPRDESVQSMKHPSQWELLMRRYSEDVKGKFENCKRLKLDWTCEQLPPRHFPTGSVYEGTWDALGMSGYGIYTYASGVVYEGEFEDGEFHGEGEVRYPMGIKIRGRWHRGELKEKTITFTDGVEYNEKNWQYCKLPDRRFTVEYENGLRPAGKTYKTAEQPTRIVPPGYYDTGEGFYDPKTKTIYKHNNINEIVRCPEPAQQDWIVDNCVTAPEVSVGARPDLYPEWTEPTLVPESEPLAPVLPAPEFSDDNLNLPTARIGSSANPGAGKKDYTEDIWGRKPLIKFEPEAFKSLLSFKSQIFSKDHKETE